MNSKEKLKNCITKIKSIFSINVIAKALIFIGLIIIVLEVYYCKEMCHGKEMTLPKVYLILSIFSGGVILAVGGDILRKFHNEKFEKFLRTEEVTKMMNDFVNNHLEKLDENKEKFENNDDDYSGELSGICTFKNEDALIVPCGKTIEWIKKLDNTYFCPSYYSHKETKYLALYYWTKIQEFGEYTRKSATEIFKDREWLKEKFEKEFGKVDDLKFYQFIDENPENLSIKNDLDYPFVRKIRYIKAADLENNKGGETSNLINPKNK